jgi:hypothetical protein
VQRGSTLASAICAIALSLHAEIPIAGRVVDENNAGVAAARVTFHSEAGDITALCDVTGGFAITLPAEGTYTARAEREGFFPLKDFAVQIQSGTREVHLTLNHVREVTESVNVHDSAGAVDVDKVAAERKLTGLEMIDVPYTPTRDLRAALTLMPGVMQDPGGSLHFDGAAEGQTQYLLDGFNFSDPLTGALNTRLSVESVRTLDWASGQYAAEFGKGSGGTLAIHTDMGDDQWRSSATNFLPGFDTRGGFHLGTWAPRFNLSGPIVPGRVWFSEHMDLEYSQPVVPDLPRGQNTTEIFQGSNIARVQANLTPSQILFADFLIDYTFAPRTGLDAIDPLSTTADHRSRTWFGSVKDQIYFKRGMLLEVGVAQDTNVLRVIPQGDSYYQLTPYQRGGNFYEDSAQRSRRDQLLGNLFLPAWGKHRWKIGTDLDRLRYWQQFRRSGIDVYDLTGTLVRQTTFGGSGLLAQPGLEASWYAMDDWKIRPDLLIEYGIRQDWDELLRRAAFSPRVSASWAPFGSKDTKVTAGYAVVRDATPLQLFTRPRDQYAIEQFSNGQSLVTSFVIPNPRLAVPLYQNWTAGLERRFDQKFDVTLTGLRKRGDNGLAYVPGPDGIHTLANARRDSYDSVEVAVRQKFGEQYEWMASYTRSRAYSNQVIDVTVDQPLQVLNDSGPVGWDAPNRFLSWGYLPTMWRNWAVGYSMEWRTGFPYSQVNDFGQVVGAVNSERFPRFFTLNIHPEWKFNLFGRRWALRAGVNNLTNHENPVIAQTISGMPVRFYGSEGRHFIVRIRWLGRAS